MRGRYVPPLLLALIFISVLTSGIARRDFYLIADGLIGLGIAAMDALVIRQRNHTERALREHVTTLRGENVLLRAELNRQKRTGLQGNGRWT